MKIILSPCCQAEIYYVEEAVNYHSIAGIHDGYIELDEMFDSMPGDGYYRCSQCKKRFGHDELVEKCK